jgi:N6-adenosine-specific RNA methylase IME4
MTTISGTDSGTKLTRYEAACRALAEARSVDEAKDIRNKAVAMAAYARQAKNRNLEADAVEIRMRATRRLDELRRAQKKMVGLAKGGGGRHGRKRVVEKPTLSSQGIDKNLAQQARVLGALSDSDFERVVDDARGKVTRAVRNAVREAEIRQEHEVYAKRTEQGSTVADLHALAASGFRAGVIYVDPAWTFSTYSGKGKQRSPERHYDVMSLDEIKALPVGDLAADDCVLLLWGVCHELPGAIEVLRAWGFKYSTVGFAWVKQNPSGEGIFTGLGYHTRSNVELCLLGLRGAPRRLAKDVHQVVLAPVGEHSAKPEEVACRIERLYPGPYLELFARLPRDGWTTWGNEILRLNGSNSVPVVTPVSSGTTDAAPIPAGEDPITVILDEIKRGLDAGDKWLLQALHEYREAEEVARRNDNPTPVPESAGDKPAITPVGSGTTVAAPIPNDEWPKLPEFLRRSVP